MIDHFFFFLGEVCRKYFADSFTVLDWKNVSVLHAVGLSERGDFHQCYLSARKCFRKAACCAGPPFVASVLAATVLLRPVPFSGTLNQLRNGAVIWRAKGHHRAGLGIKSSLFSKYFISWPRAEPGSLCLVRYRSSHSFVGFCKAYKVHLGSELEF